MQQTALATAFLALMAAESAAGTLTFNSADIGMSPTFNEVRDFAFSIQLSSPLVAGQSYTQADVDQIDYNVFGILSDLTPSGFPAFDLRRSIGGTEFVAQGSSLSFSIDAGADLSDGLQLRELDVTRLLLDAVEIGTGRYHPPELSLAPDGTGRLRNSNNQGGVNPATSMVVSVTAGQEYDIQLVADPSLTLGTVVPLPPSMLALGAGVVLLAGWRRR